MNSRSSWSNSKQILFKNMILAPLLMFILGSTVLVLSHPTFIGYWGQSKSSNLYQDNSLSEQSLSQVCQSTQFTQIHLAYLRDPISIDNLPGIDFSKHCQFPRDASLPQYKNLRPTSGFALLTCPNIRDGIIDCHRLGKQVILSISPVTSITTNQQAEQFANTLWSLFFGGDHPQRPFGTSILDGIELTLRTDQYKGYVTVVNKLKQLAMEFGTPMTIIVSPRCDYPDAVLGPVYPDRLLTAESGALESIDAINVHFMASISCSFNGNPIGFQNAIHAWANYARAINKPMYITLPGFGYGYEAYFDAQMGDFVEVSQFLNDTFWNRFMQYGDTFQGIGLWDVSADDWNLPCTNLTLPDTTTSNTLMNNTTRYSDLFSWALDRYFTGQSFTDAKCTKKTTILPNSVSTPMIQPTSSAGDKGSGSTSQFDSHSPNGALDSSKPVANGWKWELMAIAMGAFAQIA